MNTSCPPSWRASLTRIESMLPGELRRWIDAYLSGRDHLLAASDTPPSVAFAEAFTYLSAGRQQLVRDSLLALIAELFCGDHPVADAEFSSELLLVAQFLPLPESALPLESLANSDRFANWPEEIQLRVLQSLVAFEVRMTLDFWWQILERSPSTFGVIAFNGMALSSWHSALSLLLSLPDDPLVAQQVGCSLPSFLERNVAESADVLAHVLRLAPALSANIRRHVLLEVHAHFSACATSEHLDLLMLIKLVARDLVERWQVARSSSRRVSRLPGVVFTDVEFLTELAQLYGVRFYCLPHLLVRLRPAAMAGDGSDMNGDISGILGYFARHASFVNRHEPRQISSLHQDRFSYSQ